jgi:hypothetical protein
MKAAGKTKEARHRVVPATCSSAHTAHQRADAEHQHREQPGEAVHAQTLGVPGMAI